MLRIVCEYNFHVVPFVITFSAVKEADVLTMCV